MMKYTAKGKIPYFDDGTVSLLIDQELVDYYRSMIPKHIWIQKTKFPAHITVVRGPVETWNYFRWGLDNGAIYSYNYFPEISFSGKYCFLNIVISPSEERWDYEVGRVKLKIVSFDYLNKD